MNERGFESGDGLVPFPPPEAENTAKPETLTNEKIIELRREIPDDSFEGKVYEYATENGSVSLYRMAMMGEDITPANIARVKRLYEQRQTGEEFPHEFMLGSTAK